MVVRGFRRPCAGIEEPVLSLDPRPARPPRPLPTLPILDYTPFMSDTDSRPSQNEFERLRFAAIIESSDDGIVSKDLDGTVRSWNPGAERIFGYGADEMVGQPIFKLIPPELRDEEHSLLARIAQGEHISHYETERVRKDGRRIRISLTLSPLRDRTGRLIGASIIKRDRSEE